MVLVSSTNLIKYTKIRWVGFNTDQSHSWLLLQLIQIDRVHSIGNSFTHRSVLYSVRWDEMCRIRLFYKRSKILEWSECGRKARHKKWIEKKSFWHAWDLNARCSCDRYFLYLFDSNPSSHNSRGADWRVKSEMCLARSDLVYRW